MFARFAYFFVCPTSILILLGLAGVFIFDSTPDTFLLFGLSILIILLSSVVLTAGAQLIRKFWPTRYSLLFAVAQPPIVAEPRRSKHEELILDLDHRIKVLRRQSWISLSLICAVLTASAVVIVFAGYLTSLDLAAGSLVDRTQAYLISSEVSLAENQLSLAKAIDDIARNRARLVELGVRKAEILSLPSVAQAAASLVANRETRALSGKTQPPQSDLKDTIRYDPTMQETADNRLGGMSGSQQDSHLLSALLTLPSPTQDADKYKLATQMNGQILESIQYYQSTIERVDLLHDTVNRIESDVEDREKIVNNAWLSEVDAAKRDKFENEHFLLASSATRIGVIVVAIFMVQILIGLYRYNTRLATFYAARKDVLRILGAETAKYAEVGGFFVPPDNVDFGKPPKLLFERVAAALGFRRENGTRLDSKQES